MAQVELIMPKMGESIMEATILRWLKKEGDPVDTDESIVEIATDKVDSEVPSTESGVIAKLLFEEGDVVEVGKPIAIINTDGSVTLEPTVARENVKVEPVTVAAESTTTVASKVVATPQEPGRFYSPLVLNIARREGVPMAELDTIPGTGKNNRVTKRDMLAYLESRGNKPQQKVAPVSAAPKPSSSTVEPVSANGNVEIVEMDRMRKMIAEHMVHSKSTSAHVTSFVEADVTNMVLWREKIKDKFSEREGEKITFTPLFIEVVIKALKDFPKVNASLDGDKLLVKKDLNIGMATALPSGNLIVPVIKNADQYNLVGLTKQVNKLSNNARNNKLNPTDIEGGTFTLSNVGTFGNLMGTPIINQPQLAILATGAIKKKPVVIETPTGDTIGIRHMMFLSLSYDHRVIDGFLGGSCLRRIADYMEAFDVNREL